tara:strand:+ start:99 stop:395 length:297 start_codon:yes stop_codon:yes gene_type:complete
MATVSSPLASPPVRTDIFGSAYDSTVEIYEALMGFAASDTKDGLVRLPDGREVNVNTITGMTTYQTYLQFINSNKEVIDNIFVFVKNLENKLDNMLSS